jgi:hypothetical protein
MVATMLLPDVEPFESPEAGGLRLLSPRPSIDRGLFDLAMRAAAKAWRQHPADATAAGVAVSPAMSLAEVLEAWRATERELAGMTGDSPDQELLEANATMLHAMYQRLFVERSAR